MGMLDLDDDPVYRLKGQTYSINVITAVTKTKPTELHFDFLNTRKLNNIKTFKAMLNYRSLFAHVHPGTHPAFTYFYYLLSILAYLLHIL